MFMNKNTYLGFALAACMGAVSAPLFAEVSLAPEHPANITAPTTSAKEHQAAAELHKKQAAYHKAMVEHYKSLIAAEYEKGGQADLNKHYEVIVTHHDALSAEHQKAAATHEAMVKPK
jgi:hypothetical protein